MYSFIPLLKNWSKSPSLFGHTKALANSCMIGRTGEWCHLRFLLCKMPVACPVAVAQQTQYERTPFSAETAGKLNSCLGGENPLVVPLLEINHLAHPCHWSWRLGTGTVLVMPGLLPCQASLSTPHTLLPLLSVPVQTSAYYVVIIWGLQR